MSDHYAYIHILPENTGDSYEREIVPTNFIRKFDYEQYKQNNSYKKQCFKFKRSEDGKKCKCYVLYAGDSYQEVQEYVKEANKNNRRFRIPKTLTFNESNDSTTSAETTNAKTTDETQAAKSKRKACKQLQNENKRVQAASLINNYIHSKAPNVEFCESETCESQSSMEDKDVHHTSTPIRERTSDNVHNDNANIQVAEAYKMQMDYFKNEAVKWKSKYEKLKNEIQENPVVHNASADDNYAFAEYDRIYNLSYTEENRQRHIDSADELSVITLRRGVECNSLTYKRAYASSKPSDFISIISKGIYGKKELAERCVRKQKNTADKKELDSVKTEIIEEEFYNYLRVKRFTLTQIEGEIAKLNKYHHNSISIARKQLAQDKENEVNEVLECLRKEQLTKNKENDKTIESAQQLDDNPQSSQTTAESTEEISSAEKSHTE